jgi:hypothetical protein
VGDLPLIGRIRYFNLYDDSAHNNKAGYIGAFLIFFYVTFLEILRLLNIKGKQKQIDITPYFKKQRRNYMRKKRMILIILMILFLGFWMMGSNGKETKQVPELDVKRTDKPMKIDGVLDDEAWQQQPLDKVFINYNPTHGETFPQKTLVWISYDSKTSILPLNAWIPTRIR